MPLEAGRTGQLAVGDRARTLVLLREGAEVRRMPLTLKAGETVAVRP